MKYLGWLVLAGICLVTGCTSQGLSTPPSVPAAPIRVVAFDEHEETLQAIIDGEMHGTVVQNPYEYGRQSVRILAGLTRGQSLAELGVPETGFLNIQARQIRKDNVAEFWAELKKNLGEE